MAIAYANLLLADPDEARQVRLATPLQRSGWYAVTAVSQTNDLLALLQQTASYDLLLVDIHFLAADNFALLQTLQAEELWRDMPVLALASPDDIALVTQSVQLGVRDYLLYPENFPLLQARINASLQMKLLQEQYTTSLAAFGEVKALADDLRDVILPLGIALSAEDDNERLLEKIVVEAKLICNADGATLYLCDNDNCLQFSISMTASLGIAYGGTTGLAAPYDPLPLYEPQTGLPNHHNIATHVFHERYSVSIPDIYAEQNFDFSGTRAFDQQNNYRSVSCLTVPLQTDRVIGVLQLLNAQDPEQADEVQPFTLYHQRVVESLASQAAIVLVNQQLEQEQTTLLRYRRELQIGRRIQQSFFPTALPQLEGWELDVHFQSAREVAGDFYDVIALPNGRFALVVADVCDKGVVAALFMALFRSLLRAFLQQYYHLHVAQTEGAGLTIPPDDQEALLDAVKLTNSYIHNNHRDTHMFVTLFMAIFDPETGELVYVNSGHNPPMLVRDGEIVPLAPTGPAVGLQRESEFAVEELVMQPDTLLFAYTDGVVEARDEQGEMFGVERLRALALAEKTAVSLLDAVETAVRQHTDYNNLFDDITMLALYRGS
ncbi:MAG: SpoIIE family protein phosphatase [Chloroflexota bacterium]